MTQHKSNERRLYRHSICESHASAHTAPKTIVLAILAAILVLALASSVAALARPRPVVSGFGVVNGIAAPGNDFTLAINLSNDDVVCAMSAIVTVKPTAPLAVQTTTNAPPVNVCQGQTGVVLIQMHIDATAVGGPYQIPVTIDYEDTLNTPYTSTDTVTLQVQGTPVLQAHFVDTQPVDIYPGDTATVTVQLENAGTYAAQNVRATFSSSPSDPIDIKEASAVSTVAQLDARKSVMETFSVEVPKNAAAHDYPIQLSLQYLDQDRNPQLKIINLMLPVKKKAIFDASMMPGRGLFADDNSRTVQINITNTGTDTAYNVKLKVAPQFPFTTDGSVRYIKALAPGQSVPVEFVFSVDKDGAVGAYSLSLIVDFEDAQGKQLHDTADMPLAVQHKGFFRIVFIDLWYLWVLVIVIAAIIIVRRKKMVKQKK